MQPPCTALLESQYRSDDELPHISYTSCFGLITNDSICSRAAAAEPWAKPGFKDAMSKRFESWARGTIYELDKEGQCDCDPGMKPSCVCAAIAAAAPEAESRAPGGGGRSSPEINIVGAATEAETGARKSGGGLAPVPIILIVILSIVGAPPLLVLLVCIHHVIMIRGTSPSAPPPSGNPSSQQHRGHSGAPPGGPSAAPSAPEYPSGGFVYPPAGLPQQHVQMMPSSHNASTDMASSSQAPALPDGDVVMGIPTKN